MKQTNRLAGILGTLLILAGLGLVGHYAWGKAQVAYHQGQLRETFEETLPQFPEPHQKETGPLQVTFKEWVPMRITIPKINVDLMVLSGSVFDKNLLDKAPVHYEMSDLPSTKSGNVAIAGHRAGRWGFFYHLHELAEGDRIYLYMGGYRFAYSVKQVYIIQPNDWSVIHTTSVPSLTLTTCEPLNRKATHRLVARAELDNVTPLSRKQ
jgi:sortase A